MGQTPADDLAAVQLVLQSGTANNPALPDNLVPLVIAQAQNESNNFSSNVFDQTNNCFGYTTPSTYGVSTFEGFAVYNSVSDSAQEIVDYLYRRQADQSFPDLSTITTADQYAQLLSAAGYYTSSATDYASRIQSFLNQDVIQPIEQNPWTAAAVLGGLIIVGWLIFGGKKR